MEQLDDRILLSAAAVSNDTSVAPQPAPAAAIQTFLKWEGDFISFQDGVLGTEIKWLKFTENQMPPSAADYFLKLDSDLAKIGSDLVGGQSPTITADAASVTNVAATNKVGGIDGAIIAGYPDFSGRAFTDAVQIQTDLKIMAHVDTSLNSVANGTPAVSNAAPGGSADPVDAYLKFEQIKYKEQTAANELNTTFLKLDAAFVGTNLQTSMTSLGGDLAPLPVDTAPQNSRAFDEFLKFEDNFLKVENTFLKLEAAYIKDLPNGPSALSNYFLKLDTDYLKLDIDLAGNAPGISSAVAQVGGANVGGINGVLINSNLPADVIVEIQDKWSPIHYKEQAALIADITALQPPTTPAVSATIVTTPPASQDANLEGGFLKWIIAEAVAVLDGSFLKFQAGLFDGDPNRPLIDNFLIDLNTLAADAGDHDTHPGDK